MVTESLLKRSYYERVPRWFFDPLSKRVLVAYVHRYAKYMAYDPVSRIWFNHELMREIHFDEKFEVVDNNKDKSQS